MKENKTWILLFLLFFGAACFGCGTLYGQFMLKEKGFVFEAASEEQSETNAAEKDFIAADDEDNDKTKVNINEASVNDLQAVPGLGVITAKKIVSSREDTGSFDDVHDLAERGILGEGKLKQIEPYLEVK